MNPAIQAYLDAAERARMPITQVVRVLIYDFHLSAHDAGTAIATWAHQP